MKIFSAACGILGGNAAINYVGCRIATNNIYPCFGYALPFCIKIIQCRLLGKYITTQQNDNEYYNDGFHKNLIKYVDVHKFGFSTNE